MPITYKLLQRSRLVLDRFATLHSLNAAVRRSLSRLYKAPTRAAVRPIGYVVPSPLLPPLSDVASPPRPRLPTPPVPLHTCSDAVYSSAPNHAVVFARHPQHVHHESSKSTSRSPPPTERQDPADRRVRYSDAGWVCACSTPLPLHRRWIVSADDVNIALIIQFRDSRSLYMSKLRQCRCCCGMKDPEIVYNLLIRRWVANIVERKEVRPSTRRTDRAGWSTCDE